MAGVGQNCNPPFSDAKGFYTPYGLKLIPSKAFSYIAPPLQSSVNQSSILKIDAKLSMMILSNRIFFFAVCWLLCLPIFGQESIPDEMFPAPSISSISSYGLGEGLPTNCLRNLFTDHKGRLWINPCYGRDLGPGLNFFQYDGAKAKFFKLQPEWTKNNQDTLIWQVMGETSQGFLYGADHTRSVAFLWNPDSEEQYLFPFREREHIHGVLVDSQDRLLTLTWYEKNYRIYHLKKDGAQQLSEIHVDVDQAIFPQFPVSIVEKENSVWFFHQSVGLINLDLEDGNGKLYAWKDLTNTSISQGFSENQTLFGLPWKIQSFRNDSLLLFLGSQNGFFSFNTKTLELLPFSTLNQFFFEGEEFSWTGGELVLEDNHQNILIRIIKGKENPHAAENINENQVDRSLNAILIDPQGGLFDYSALIAELSLFSQYRSAGFGEGRFFSKNFNRQILWASNGGLVIADLQPHLEIDAYQIGRGMRAIGQLDDNRLLVNTDANTLQLDLRSSSFSVYPEAYQKINTLSSLRRSHENDLWIGRLENEFLRIDPIQNTFEAIPVGIDFDKFIFRHKEEIIFFSKQGECFFFDLQTQKVKSYVYKGVPFSIKSIPNELLFDQDSILWVAARNGLWKIDIQRDKIEQINLPQLQDENIMCIHVGEERKLWIGTAQKGVFILDKETYELKQISEVNGLSNNTVAGILVDNRGNRWISTFDGISVVSPNGKVLFDLSEFNGLTHSEFNRTSYSKLPDGRLVFGGVQGVNILNPDQILDSYIDQEPLKIFLTRLEYYREDTKIVANSSTNEKTIPIPAANRYLYLDFSLSEYVDLAKHTYAYRLLSINEKDDSTTEVPWINLGSVSELTLNALPVGKYVVQVRGVNHRRKQTEKNLEIFIKVEEFFYKTWWFYLLCALPFILGAWAWVYRNATEKRRLKEEVERRTEQIRVDKETIERQAEELRELDKAKSRFFTNISHEFRTPLTIISGLNKQVRNDPNQWLEKGTELIGRNSNQLLSLINQILDLRKLEAHSLKLDLVHGDIIAYTRHIVDSFIPIAQPDNIRIHFLPIIKELKMDYDPDKILQIFSNLLSNAIKYMPEKGGDIYVQLTKKPILIETLSIQIRDTGKGISEEALPYIFDRFYQVENLAQHKPYGSGIGLSLTKELVSLMNGKIAVNSTLGEGTTFTLDLPITKSAKEVVSDHQKTLLASPLKIETIASLDLKNEAAISADSGQKSDLPTLLIVEDNVDIQLYLRAYLEKYYEVLMAKDGQEGIDMAIEHVPELIVSDVMMPQKDGFELCDTLKNHEITSHIPIILLTAKSSFESKLSGLKKGADAYVTKPFEPQELLVRIEQLLILRKKLQEKYSKIASQIGEKELSSDDLDEQFLQKLKQIIIAHISEEDFNTPRLCKAIGLGRTQLHHKIKALTGQSTSIFVRSIRLHKAKELLQTTDLNVSEVGYDVGINNPRYFARVYKEMFGYNPSEEKREG